MIIDFLLEVKESIDKHGIRFGLIFALYALYRKERRNSRLDQRDADVFHNQKVIMEHLGVGEQWRGQASPFQNEEVRSLKKLYSSLQQESRKENLLRRTKRMQNINRSWVIAVLIFIGAELNKRYGIQLPDGWENLAYNFIQGAALIGAMIFNAFHHKPQPIEVTKAIQDAPHNYAEMVPIINDVNQSLNQIHEKLKTGRYDDATKEAIDAYMKVHDLLQKKGA